ncbi:MAG: phosphatidate cytidylyltransferase [Lachnospiraceae bacterium]|nr:phosphatidate cytidylyltransferase [Lachnospiraceae bacterium]
MFRTRLLSGIVLMAIAIASLVYGGYVLFGLIMAISVVGLFELYRTVKMEKSLPGMAGYLSSIVLDILLLNRASLLTDTTENAIRYAKYHEYIILWLVLTLIVFMAMYVIAYPKYHANQISMLVFGLIYVTVMLSFVFRLRYVENGILYVWLIFIGAWGSDTCAYCVGKLVGKHKMPSELSPNKTIEGCVGGVIGAALIGFLFALAFFRDTNYWWQFAVIGGVSSVISQIGDLAASAIKRNHDIKDYGKLIPGHGGILDRFDSIIFIAPIVYYFVIFFGL